MARAPSISDWRCRRSGREGTGYAGLLFSAHAWLAFGLIALVAVHIGIALNDYIQRGAQRL